VGTLNARAASGVALSTAARTCTSTEDDPRALLERFASQKGSLSTAGPSKANQAPLRTAATAATASASRSTAASAVDWLLGFPLLLLLFLGRLLLVFVEKLKPSGRVSTTPTTSSSSSGSASGTPVTAEGAASNGASGVAAFASSGALANLMGGLGGGGGGGGGVLGLISQAMAAWGLARELQKDLCALLTTLLGVVAVGEAVSRVLASEQILECV